MVRSPMTPSLRTAAHPLTTMSARARTSISSSKYLSSRSFSTPCTRALGPRSLISSGRALPRSSHRNPPRPFASASRRYYGGSNRYNRFDGQQRQSFIAQSMAKARPVHFVIVGGVLGGFYVYNTDTVEMTGRRRFNCVSHQLELKMGMQGYKETIQQYRGRILPPSHPHSIMVNRVLQRLIPLAPMDNANWEVHVIKDDEMENAFVLPGGKVFVFTGILPICQDEDGLAAVLGHEIAHVVAHHTGERMSNSFVTLGIVLLIASLFDVSGALPNMVLQLMWGLPNSRTQEAEADNIGLMIMSRACFNPEAAADLWARMHQAEKQAPPQFMSTHPASYNRMESIRKWLDEAQMEYENSGCSGMGSYLPGFRQAREDFNWS